MKKKIQLDGNVVSKSTGAAPEARQTVPQEKLRPLLLHLAEEVADASKANLDAHTLEMMIQTALCLHGLGHLAASPEVPETPAKNLTLHRPRIPPWEKRMEDFSSGPESDIDLDVSGFF